MTSRSDEATPCFFFSLSLVLLLPRLLIHIAVAHCHFSAPSIPGRFICSPRFSNTHLAFEKTVVFTKMTTVQGVSLLCLGARRLICGEVLELSNITSASRMHAPHCVTLFHIIPLEISICGLMNTDCFASRVISVSSRLLKPEKSGAQLNQEEWSRAHCFPRLLLSDTEEKYFT